MTIRSACPLLPVVLITASCATTPAGKPILTADIFNRVAAGCDAVGQFHQREKGLPYVEIALEADAQTADGPAPELVCVTDALRPYQYDYIAIGNASASK